MPPEAIGSMMKHAVDGGYAVGYFESWNLESLQGVVDAAELTGSPVILGFNGAFLSGPRLASERLSWYAALGRTAAESLFGRFRYEYVHGRESVVALFFAIRKIGYRSNRLRQKEWSFSWFWIRLFRKLRGCHTGQGRSDWRRN